MLGNWGFNKICDDMTTAWANLKRQEVRRGADSRSGSKPPHKELQSLPSKTRINTITRMRPSPPPP